MAHKILRRNNEKASSDVLVVDASNTSAYALLTQSHDPGGARPGRVRAEWKDITSEIVTGAGGDGGGGSAFAHLTEDADNQRLTADWSLFVTQGDPNADPLTAIYNGAALIQNHSAATEVFAQYDLDGSMSHAVFSTNGDGSLHWGDGSAAPDAHLSRLAEGAMGLEGYLGVFAANGPIFGVSTTGDDQDRLQIDTNGVVSWGDGTNPPDVSLSRANGEGFWGSGLLIDKSLFLMIEDTSEAMGVANDAGTDGVQLDLSGINLFAGGHSTILSSPAQGLLGLLNVNGGGVQAKSPDGTVYNLIPPNGGGAASWVAA